MSTWKETESKLIRNRGEMHQRRGGRVSWIESPRAPQMSRGSEFEKKNRERSSGPRALGTMIKQAFKEQPHIGLMSLETRRSKGQPQLGFWDHVWPLHTLCPFSYEWVPPPLPWFIVVIRHYCKFSGDHKGIEFVLECQSSGALCGQVVWLFLSFFFFNVCWTTVWLERRKDADWSGCLWLRGKSKQSLLVVTQGSPSTLVEGIAVGILVLAPHSLNSTKFPACGVAEALIILSLDN